MTYLSRIWLNPLRPEGQRILRNPQVAHAAVLGGLSRQPVNERVLWRLEARDAHRLELLVLTQSLPSWEHVVERAGWPHAEDAQVLVRDYAPLLNRVVTGREFAFRVKANTASATKAPLSPSAGQKEHLAKERPRGVVVPHTTVAAQHAWLLAHLGGWGFEGPTGSVGQAQTAVVGRERLSFMKGPDGDQRHRVVLSTATFEGRVRVLDAELARRSLVEGVGRGKAYGCGLITLAPVQGGG